LSHDLGETVSQIPVDLGLIYSRLAASLNFMLPPEVLLHMQLVIIPNSLIFCMLLQVALLFRLFQLERLWKTLLDCRLGE